MSFITQILDTYKKGRRYDEDIKTLLQQTAILTDDNRWLQSQQEELLTMYSKEKNDNELLKEQVSKLLKKGVVDVSSLKDYYEQKFGNLTWLYDYNSDGTLSDVKNSLVVPAEEQEHIEIITTLIINKYDLTSSTPPSEIVGKIKKYFSLRSSWTYKYDQEYYGRPDFWAPAHTSAQTRKGDCDDLAILMHCVTHSTLIRLGLEQHYFRLKLTASMVLGEGGHAYNLWLHNDGEWYVVESTYDLRGSLDRNWLKTPVKNNNTYYSFWGFARKDRSFVGSGLESLNPYEE